MKRQGFCTAKACSEQRARRLSAKCTPDIGQLCRRRKNYENKQNTSQEMGHKPNGQGGGGEKRENELSHKSGLNGLPLIHRRIHSWSYKCNQEPMGRGTGPGEYLPLLVCSMNVL